MCIRDRLTDAPAELIYCDVAGEFKTVAVPENGFAYTMFQVPIVYQPGDTDLINVMLADGSELKIEGTSIDQATSEKLFSRMGEVVQISCRFRQLRDQ